MVYPINRDILILKRPSSPATKEDATIGKNLLDTLIANRETCVGMAANMIGVNKRIIAVNLGMAFVLMYNPVITAKAKPYQTEEGCLSLEGVRPTTRYEEITVSYQDAMFQKKTKKFTGWGAQIIQHEVDHCNGILI